MFLLSCTVENDETTTEEENTRIEHISAGMTHSLAVSDNGMVWAWGDNEYGQLGNGSKKEQISPGQVKQVKEIYSVAAGVGVSYAIDSKGLVMKWPNKNNLRTEYIKELNNVIKIDTFTGDLIALKEDGSVWTLGSNMFGQCGDGTKGFLGIGDFGKYMYDEKNKVKNEPVNVKNLESVIDVASGIEFNLALKGDGTVWAWGRNDQTYLGTGLYQKSITVPSKVIGIENIISIDAGQYALALKNDGTVWIWGQHKTPQRIDGLQNIVKISSGGNHFLALDENGTVWAWGDNRYGAIGDHSKQYRNELYKIKELYGIIDISAGEFYSMALSQDGIVWTWGYNNEGQLGTGNTEDKLEPTKIEIFKD